MSSDPLVFNTHDPVPIVSGDWRKDIANVMAPESTEGLTLFPKQELAERLSTQVDELLFGGAAGPGKTEWGMEHVIRQMLMYPRNRGIIFRRVYPSLEESVIPRMKEKLRGRASWNGGRRDFTFPNGSVLTLGHLQYKDSVTVYQGAQFGVIFFEELTEFLRSQYEYMLHRLRPPDLGQGMHPHVVSTTNPGGVGHTWVKRRFVNPPEVDLPLDEMGDPIPVELSKPWQPRPTDDNPAPTTRAFVPATMEDNPLLMEKDPTYVSRINAISDRGLRLAMKTGDWDAIDQIEGAYWKQSWFDDYRIHRLATEPIRRVLALDPSDGTESKDGDEFGVWAGCKGLDGIGYTEYSDGWMDSPAMMARRAIKEYYDRECDAIIVEKNHGGPWIKTTLLGIDPNVNVIMLHASHGKLVRAEPIAALFDPSRSVDGNVRAKMIDHHPDLEGECTTYRGMPGDASPNRLDAMVWGLFELMIEDLSGPAKIHIPRRRPAAPMIRQHRLHMLGGRR
jgi:phage terminase large subunit-like protein